MISFKDAQSIIAKNCKKSKIIKTPLMEALNAICAYDILAKMNVPSFDNSAMDGFGVKISWLESASIENPIKIKNTQAIAAGQIVSSSNSNQTCHIMTGAKCPNWVEAIIPIENVTIDGDYIIFTNQAQAGQNIRHIGEDCQINDILINANSKITPEHIMVLASQGIAQVDTFEKPNIKIISTGNEIKAFDSGPLEDGQIYNSNAPYLLSKAAQLGLNAEFAGIFDDGSNDFKNFLSKDDGNSIVISTGAVSAGKWDFIPNALKEMGATIHFHKVNIRPGKPILFATLKNGSLFFGLPGNPISSAIGFEFFVKYALEEMAAIAKLPHEFAILQNSFTKKFKGTQFLKSKIISDKTTKKVSISDGQESFKIAPFAHANAWVILPEGLESPSINSIVEVKRF